MEKRRRARINASLTELKSLLLEAIKKEGARQNKMEKADILEMAVKHLRHIQRQQFTGESQGEHQLAGESSNDSPEVSKYQLGFHACVQEVCKYLDSNRDEDIELKTKLLNHLANSMTGADYPTTSTASSSVLSSPSSSSSSSSPYVIHFSASAKPSGQSPPLSSEMQNAVQLERRSVLSMCPQSREISQTDPATSDVKPKLHVRNSSSGQVLQRMVRGTNEGILHTVLTSPSNSVFVKPNMLSLSTSGNLAEARCSEDDRQNSSSQISSTSKGTLPARSVTEVNNNSIILPALVNMAAPTTFTYVQQPNQQQQQQQTQVYQQQNQTPLFPSVPEGSSIFTGSNSLQLIPTKTINGEIAFLLSTTNLLSSSQIPSFSIPVITQPAVGHTQILAPPIAQPAIQIALSYPPEDPQQAVTFITNSVQPIIQPAHPNASKIHSSIFNTPGQATPLNLSSTNQQSLHTTHQLMPKRTVAPPTAESEHHADNQPITSYASPSHFIRQTNLSEGGRYNYSPYTTKSSQVEHSDLKRQTPLDTLPADLASTTFLGQAVSSQPDAHASAIITDHGRSVYDRSEIGLAEWRSHLGPASGMSSGSQSYNLSTRGHFFRPWRE